MTVSDVFNKYQVALFDGLKVTLSLCAIIWGVGVALGVTVGILSARFPRLLSLPVRLTALLTASLPPLVLLFWMHYPAQKVVDVVIDPFKTAAFCLTMMNVILVAELVRGILADFPQQYIVAGVVCGLTSRQLLLRVELPLILRQLVPPLLHLQVIMLQSTLFASSISVNELFRVAQRINSNENEPVIIYSTLAIFFVGICMPIHGLAIWLRSRYSRDLSER